MKRLAVLAAVLFVAACGSSENAAVEENTELAPPATTMSPEDSVVDLDSLVPFDSTDIEHEM